MEANNQLHDQGVYVPPNGMQPASTEAMLFIEQTLQPTHGDHLEHFMMKSRIQDLIRLFPDGNINMYHDFANEKSLRHLTSWDGVNAYRAVAAWMNAVGPEKYKSLAPKFSTMWDLGHKAVADLSERYLTSQTAEEKRQHNGPYPANVRRLLKVEDTSWKGLISTYREYKVYRDSYNSLYNQSVLDRATDLPANDPSFQAHVQKLYLAAQDMSDTMENDRIGSTKGKKRKAPGDDEEPDEGEDHSTVFKPAVAVQRVKKLSSIELEMLCWEIVEEAWNHQRGQSNIPQWYEQGVRKANVYESFEERIDECANALRVSKNAIKSMLGISFAKRLAGDPKNEVKRKMGNKVLNAKRDVQNKAGIYATEKGLVKVNKQTRSITHNGEEIAPAHPLAKALATSSAAEESGEEEGQSFASPSGQRSSPFGQQAASSPFVQQATSSPFGQQVAPPGAQSSPQRQQVAPFGAQSSPSAQQNAYGQPDVTFGHLNTSFGQHSTPHGQQGTALKQQSTQIDQPAAFPWQQNMPHDEQFTQHGQHAAYINQQNAVPGHQNGPPGQESMVMVQNPAAPYPQMDDHFWQQHGVWGQTPGQNEGQYTASPHGRQLLQPMLPAAEGAGHGSSEGITSLEGQQPAPAYDDPNAPAMDTTGVPGQNAVQPEVDWSGFLDSDTLRDWGF